VTGDQDIQGVKAGVVPTRYKVPVAEHLIGFGLDSLVEVASAAAVAWQFAADDPQRRRRTALRVIAWSFFVLAAYVTVEAVRTLVGGRKPSTPRSTSRWLRLVSW
jgi:hypothetical protein